MNRLILIAITFILIRCGNATENNSKVDSSKIGSKSNVKMEVKNESVGKEETLGSSKVVKAFYNWYLNNIYGKDENSKYEPNIVKIRDLKYQIDTSAYLTAIRETGYFSEKYIGSEKNKLDECNKVMMDMNFEEEPEAYFNEHQCGFLWSDRWLGGQGQPVDDFKITSANQVQNRAKIVVQTFSENTKFNRIEINLTNFSGEWKIDQIELVD